MNKKRKPLSDKLKEEEGLKTTEKEALNILDYFAMNGVEILRGNPIYVNGLERLTTKLKGEPTSINITLRK